MERNSILCPHCRKLISRDEQKCPYCDMPILAARWQEAKSVLTIANSLDPVKTIVILTIFYFLSSLLLSSLQAGYSPGFLLTPSETALFHLGAGGAIPIVQYERYWALLSASFLHGGILHISFNMLALWQIGGFVWRCYGLSRFLVIYILTGVAGFCASFLAGVPLTIGASASICGLIGVIIYYGRTRGGFYGGMVYKQALGWVISIAIFGLIMPGIDNWAHGGGLLSGIVLGKLLGYNESTPESIWHKSIALLLAALTLAVLSWSLMGTLLGFYR
jgi:rhomboid protease GluP